MGYVGKILTGGLVGTDKAALGGLGAANPEMALGGVLGSRLFKQPQMPPVAPPPQPKRQTLPDDPQAINKKPTLLGGGNLG